MNTHAIPAEVHMVARRIQRGGGRALLVGGSVIDLLCDRAAKDWDLEVFGLDFDQITALFPDHPVKEAGRAFGILKLNVDGVDVDINVPRTDNKVGKGHKDFVVEVDPTMSVREAARRRDFTINTLAMDIATGEIVDEWGGLRDLSFGVLRATDPDLFREDSLRVWRAVQLLPRKALSVDPHTMLLMRSMVRETEHLPPERLFAELEKLMLKAEKPSIGVQLASDLGLWEFMAPELSALASTGQSPDHHPEGNVMVHSLLALDAAAELRSFLPEEDRLVIMLAAFLHDIGKPLTTITPEMVARDEAPKVRLWTAWGHDQKGRAPADLFLSRFTGERGGKKLRQKVTCLVGEHMQPWNLMQGNASGGAWARLHRRLGACGLTLRHLASVCQCDSCATSADWKTRSLKTGSPDWNHKTSQLVLDRAAEFENAPPDPKVQGRDLIARKMKPGWHFGPILEKCLELQDAHPKWSVQELIDGAMA